MRLFLTLILLTMVFSIRGQGQSVNVSSGSVIRLPNFASQYVQPRNIDVWLPKNYPEGGKYDVLYMHDGQMLFDSTQTWNKQEWQVDEHVSRLIEKGKIRNCIVVGIWNISSLRHREYWPEKAFKALPLSVQDSVRTNYLKENPLSDNYLKFLVEELKPYIDSHFSVYTDSQHTFIAGSSMGGLISMYAICEYPNTFGGAACLSTHWVGIHKANQVIPESFNKYLDKHLPNPENHRLYFDYGTATLDSLYQPHQALIDQTLKKHFNNSDHWQTVKFVGADHTERSWSKRLDTPLIFLLVK